MFMLFFLPWIIRKGSDRATVTLARMCVNIYRVGNVRVANGTEALVFAGVLQYQIACLQCS